MKVFHPSIYSIFFFIFCSTALLGQQIKKAETGPFILKNATLHTITDGTFLGDLHIENDKIKAIGSNLPTLVNAKIIDCTNKHIYPGFIDSGTRLGLAEIESVSLTNDFNELGDFIPHMKALTAVNPNSVSIPVTRVNGITTVFTKPERNTFPGTGALIDLFGYTPDQMFAGSEAVLMNFPSTGKRGRFDRRSDEDVKKDAASALKKLNDIWEKAVLYSKIDSMAKYDNKLFDTYNPQMDALLPIVRGKSKLFIEVNKKDDIASAIKWVKEKGIDCVLTGVAEGGRIAEQIKEANLDVITGPILKVPGRSSAKYDESYQNPSIMAKAGIKVAIRTDDAENVRNLPFNAAYAASYGLGQDEALKCITINPAQIFGVDHLYGSLTVGKVANLFVSTGDPFEPKTKITDLFIRGWKAPLESRHTLLYDEFLQRSPGN
ncbi:MAG: amidohydrolase family protein [Saprospiraceae bacterium]